LIAPDDLLIWEVIMFEYSMKTQNARNKAIQEEVVAISSCGSFVFFSCINHKTIVNICSKKWLSMKVSYWISSTLSFYTCRGLRDWLWTDHLWLQEKVCQKAVLC